MEAVLNTLLFDKQNSNGPLPEFSALNLEMSKMELRDKIKMLIVENFEFISEEQNKIGGTFQIDHRQPNSPEFIEGVSMVGFFKRKFNRNSKR